MPDPANLNKSSPGVFQQPTQPAKHSLTPVISNPATGAPSTPATHTSVLKK